MEGAKLAGAKAANTVFVDTTAKGVDFSGADLRYAIMQGSDIAGATFDRCFMEQAFLKGAKAQAATFRRADLTTAVAAHADLTGADFRGAGVYRLDLHSATQDGVLWDALAAQRYGTNYPLAMAENYDAISIERRWCDHMAAG